MRFETLTVQDPEGELRVRFHAELTVLSGLGRIERRALADSIIGSVTGGHEATTLRFLDACGGAVEVVAKDGRAVVRAEDGTSAPLELGPTISDPAALRSLMLLSAEDLGTITQAERDGEPAELRSARVALDEVNAELQAGLAQQQASAALVQELDELEVDLEAARDGAARREYARALARLERVRAEAAAIQADGASVESDSHLLASAETTRSLAATWIEAGQRAAALTTAVECIEPLDEQERDRLAAIPAEPSAELEDLLDGLAQALSARHALDQRLQDLSVAKLPTPSDPIVAELGLLDQATLWSAVTRLIDAILAMHHTQIASGGALGAGVDSVGRLIEDIEAAHAKVEAASRAIDVAKMRGIGGIVASVGLSGLGLVAGPALFATGLAAGAVAAGAGFGLPRIRRARAIQREQIALEQAGASSYLGFHLRRVDATLDAGAREAVEATIAEHRDALQHWLDLAGETVDVDRAVALRDEIEAYNEALRSLGGAADEIDSLRRQLVDEADPQIARARASVLTAVEPFGDVDVDLDDPSAVMVAVRQQCDRGARARTLIDIDDAVVDLEKASARLEDHLLQVGFDTGPLDARVGAFEWAVTHAAQRAEARRTARPGHEIDAELAEMERTVAALRRPEWATVTPADAAAPDIADLEAREAELREQLEATRAEVDVARLTERRSALERRVGALEARHGADAPCADPAAISGIRDHLLAHLTKAGCAGPAGDPVPVVLDDVLLRVPADRKWDLLDLLHRSARGQQLIYLSDDAFVAAWARQRAEAGAITLMELSPEPVG